MFNKIIEKYTELCNTPSDINELLPYLRGFSKGCDVIIEMGTRRAVSTYAFLANRPKKLVCYDMSRYEEIDEVEAFAKGMDIPFEFRQEDVLSKHIEECDFLFIDTYHIAGQLSRELDLHASKVRNKIAFHDVADSTFWEKGETPYFTDKSYEGFDGRGLKYAIEPFLAAHPEWFVALHTQLNNGLMVIERHG